MKSYLKGVRKSMVVVSMQFIAVKEPFFWAGVSDQWLSTTLDQNLALLIGLWQNHEVKVSKNTVLHSVLAIQTY